MMILGIIIPGTRVLCFSITECIEQRIESEKAENRWNLALFSEERWNSVCNQISYSAIILAAFISRKLQPRPRFGALVYAY
jgi:hypothetical protein